MSAAAERRRRFVQLADAVAHLNPYTRDALRVAWRAGFNDSAARDWRGHDWTRGAERTAYGRGWNARRDTRNVERFPVIKIPPREA